jgi:hypothetical protein
MRSFTPTASICKLNRAAILLAAVSLVTAVAPAAHALPVIAPEPLPLGMPNGTPASSSAVLQPVTPASVARPYTHSALRVGSQLLDAAGQPIAGARIDILQRVSGSSEAYVVGHAITGVDGMFTARVPAGPSRTIDLAYRAYEGAPLYAAQTEIVETVSAELRLSITPRLARPTGTIVLRGQVLGIVPSHGVVVEVLVYYQGVWEPIRTPRTDSFGRIRLRYRFHQARGQFPFALRVRDGQVGFPYSNARSSRVDVLTS